MRKSLVLTLALTSALIFTRSVVSETHSIIKRIGLEQSSALAINKNGQVVVGPKALSNYFTVFTPPSTFRRINIPIDAAAINSSDTILVSKNEYVAGAYLTTYTLIPVDGDPTVLFSARSNVYSHTHLFVGDNNRLVISKGNDVYLYDSLVRKFHFNFDDPSSPQHNAFVTISGDGSVLMRNKVDRDNTIWQKIDSNGALINIPESILPAHALWISDTGLNELVFSDGAGKGFLSDLIAPPHPLVVPPLPKIYEKSTIIDYSSKGVFALQGTKGDFYDNPGLSAQGNVADYHGSFVLQNGKKPVRLGCITRNSEEFLVNSFVEFTPNADAIVNIFQKNTGNMFLGFISGSDIKQSKDQYCLKMKLEVIQNCKRYFKGTLQTTDVETDQLCTAKVTLANKQNGPVAGKPVIADGKYVTSTDKQGIGTFRFSLKPYVPGATNISVLAPYRDKKWHTMIHRLYLYGYHFE